MKIESHDRTVEALLNSAYFKVPRFQRAYSWERAEVEDFWNDTIADAEGEYFIGNAVLKFAAAERIFVSPGGVKMGKLLTTPEEGNSNSKALARAI
jgi:hypothetical protein